MQGFLFNTLLEKFSKDYIQKLKENIDFDILKNINSNFELRDYQKEAFIRFQIYFNNYLKEKKQIHLLYNMATGSGKTLIMAILILELYKKGYNKILFCVNSKNIIEKTKKNFLDSSYIKYLFNNKININGNIVNIKEVSNFSYGNKKDINIKFTTIQGLHSELNINKENSLTFDDFKNDKILILSDEAHHINSLTKSKLTKFEQEEKKSWEFTVNKILNSYKNNILLEFTATIDLNNNFIKEKYLDKIIYKYDLKEFRLDGYSKEINFLKSELSQKYRIIQAIILSQYRLKIAQKNNIFLKPVILFKAQKTIKENNENFDRFNNIIKILKEEDLQEIKKISKENIIGKAFDFFSKNNISLTTLVQEIKEDFACKNCLNVNDDKNVYENQILLNSLEAKFNKIRAIFAVQKLNEGWDVLNLFDIVRLYGDNSSKIKKSKQTISEAQLIGRGARYFPFICEKCIGKDKFKRKFDNNNNSELKILEVFYYHTFFDNKYISEIKNVLIKTGILSEKNEKKILNNHEKTKNVLEFLKQEKVDIKLGEKEIDFIVKINLKDIDKKIIKKAILKNTFYKFSNLKKYFLGLKSIDDFINNKNFLNSKTIILHTDRKEISIENKLKIVCDLLYYVENEIRKNNIGKKY